MSDDHGPGSSAVGVPSGADVSYLDAMLATLWPDAAVRATGRRAPRSATAVDFIIVPSRRHPKLLLPRRPRRATAAALGNYKASATGATRVRLRLLALAARLGAADLLPDRARVEGGGWSGVTHYLAEALGRDVVVSLYIGPPRAIQKPVLQLLSPSGETFGFAKIGVSALTRDLVRAEAGSLALLAEAGLSALSVPSVLHHGRWGAQEVLVLGAVSRSGNGAVSGPSRAAAAVELAAVRGVHPAALAQSSYWVGLRARLGSLPGSDLAAGLLSALAEIEDAEGDAPLTFGSWHGDWAPWNMTAGPGHVQAWDWEQFESDVPLGFDEVHFHVQSAVVMAGVEPAAAFASAMERSADLLSPYGVEPETARVVVLLYLVEISVRYLQDGEVEVDGTSMGRLNDWMLSTLHQQTGVVVRAARR